MNRLTRTLLIFSLMTSLSDAEVIPEGGGIIYGGDHVFALQAPKGWVLDNHSAAKSGIHAVFYPKGSTWKDSKTVAYARAHSKNDKVRKPADVVKSVLAEFHENGSPNYKAKKEKELKIEGEKTGVVYHFSGDKWGNFEAVCYFPEKKTINFIVLTSRDEASFKAALKPFEELCRSYTYIGDSYNKGKADEHKEKAEKPKG